jgi:hypothetical protein
MADRRIQFTHTFYHPLVDEVEVTAPDADHPQQLQFSYLTNSAPRVPLPTIGSIEDSIIRQRQLAHNELAVMLGVADPVVISSSSSASTTAEKVPAKRSRKDDMSRAHHQHSRARHQHNRNQHNRNQHRCRHLVAIPDLHQQGRLPASDRYKVDPQRVLL